MTFLLQVAIFSRVSNYGGTCRMEVEFLPLAIFDCHLISVANGAFESQKIISLRFQNKWYQTIA